eukprot:4427545-Prymnesium_polylepis.1
MLDQYNGDADDPRKDGIELVDYDGVTILTMHWGWGARPRWELSAHAQVNDVHWSGAETQTRGRYALTQRPAA